MPDQHYPVANLSKEELEQIKALEQRLNTNGTGEKILIAYTKQ